MSFEEIWFLNILSVTQLWGWLQTNWLKWIGRDQYKRTFSQGWLRQCSKLKLQRWESPCEWPVWWAAFSSVCRATRETHPGRRPRGGRGRRLSPRTLRVQACNTNKVPCHYLWWSCFPLSRKVLSFWGKFIHVSQGGRPDIWLWCP